jgi:hypothetical protein
MRDHKTLALSTSSQHRQDDDVTPGSDREFRGAGLRASPERTSAAIEPPPPLRPRVGIVEGTFQDKPVIVELGPDEWAAFRCAETAGYIVARQDQHQVVFAWTAWCEVRNSPFVCFFPGKPRSQLWLHLRTTHRQLTAAQASKITMLAKAVGGSLEMCTPVAVRIVVAHQTAEPLAQILIELVTGGPDGS